MTRPQDNSKKKTSSSRPGVTKKKTGTSKPGVPKKNSETKSKAPIGKFNKPKSSKPAKVVLKSDSDSIRLNKYIANSGACSRREADIYIQSGAVRVNGVPIIEMGYQVKPGDVVQFDGTTVRPEKKVYILLNKPKNFTTVGDKESAQKNVIDLVRGATKYDIAPIGRMDSTTTGLLLFTNDTDMIRKFSLPNQKSPKIYQVSLDKNLRFEDLEKISSGVTLDEHRLYVDEISYIEGEPKSEVGIKLRTSNVKVVRAIFESFKYNVLKVDRVSFAGLTKKNLARGEWRMLTEQEVINLRNI
jgi:23S rRNA pseudouridine2605 synthase